MAKRKTGRAPARRAKAARGAVRLRRAAASRTARTKAVAKKNTARKKATKAARKPALRRGAKSASASRKRAVGKAAATRKSSSKQTARRTARTRTVARAATTRKATAKQSASKRAVTSAARPQRATRAEPQAQAPRPARPAKALAPAVRKGKAPSLNRERRVAVDDDFAPSPPSSLDLDRSASAARSGRHELAEKFHEHTETSPVLTGGDIDGDWESAYSVGDEAPGGSSPTPDQTVVEDIGSALGVVYEDDEELTSEKKISDRDRHRWELDPESSDDYEER